MVVSTAAVIELLDRSTVFQTAPFLVVEMVSPSSSVDDRRDKCSEYGAIEIPEYWIVDAQQNTVTVLSLQDGFYEETIFSEDDAIASPCFPDLNITVSQVLAVGGTP